MRKGDVSVLRDSGCPRRAEALGLRTAEDSCVSEKALITKLPYCPTGLVALRLTSLTVIIKSDTFLCHYLPCIMSLDFFPLLLSFYLSVGLETRVFHYVISQAFFLQCKLASFSTAYIAVIKV